MAKSGKRKYETSDGKIIFRNPESFEYRLRIFFLLYTDHHYYEYGNDIVRRFYLLLNSNNEDSRLIYPYIIAEKGLTLNQAREKGLKELLGRKINNDGELIYLREHFSVENGQAYQNLDACYSYYIPSYQLNNDQRMGGTTYQAYGDNKDLIIERRGVTYSPVWWLNDQGWDEFLGGFANPQTDPLLAQMSSYL